MLGKAIVLLALLGLSHAQTKPSENVFQGYTSRAWQRDGNRVCDTDLIYTSEPKDNNMFIYVNETALGPTFAKFENLWRYYTTQENIADNCTARCQQDQQDFINYIFDLGPIQETFDYYRTHENPGSIESTFRIYLHDLWFTRYSRGSADLMDSGGFTHVFVGEHTPEGDVNGFHNWYRMYKETANILFVSKIRDPCGTDIPSFEHWWQNQYKQTNSMWMRTSVEVEMAIYTLCFMYAPNTACPALLDNHVQNIQTWDWQGQNTIIGAAYPLCS